jgi:hypothetical protein
LITSVLFSAFLIHHNALCVIGGEYVIPKGETLNGGSMYSLGSDVDVKGVIEGDTLSFEFFGYTVLIPELRWLQISR